MRTDKGKEILNKHFQGMLREEGIQFQVCRNTDLKCAVVESVHRTIRDRISIYFTYRNTYRYIDVLPKFVKTYNNTVPSTTGMAPSRVADSDVLAICKRMEAVLTGRVHVAKAATFQVGAARSHQQREDAVRQGYRTELQYRDFQGRESNREAATCRLWTKGFKWHANRRTVL